MSPATTTPTMSNPRKRLIMCCDGTWQNSDKGGEEGPFWNPSQTLQIPSNVTRISRSFKHVCSDGCMQIINYEAGIGTGSNTLDSIAGGAFGSGLSEVLVHHAYSKCFSLILVACPRSLSVYLRKLL